MDGNDGLPGWMKVAAAIAEKLYREAQPEKGVPAIITPDMAPSPIYPEEVGRFKLSHERQAPEGGFEQAPAFLFAPGAVPERTRIGPVTPQTQLAMQRKPREIEEHGLEPAIRALETVVDPANLNPAGGGAGVPAAVAKGMGRARSAGRLGRRLAQTEDARGAADELAQWIFREQRELGFHHQKDWGPAGWAGRELEERLAPEQAGWLQRKMDSHYGFWHGSDVDPITSDILINGPSRRFALVDEAGHPAARATPIRETAARFTEHNAIKIRLRPNQLRKVKGREEQMVEGIGRTRQEMLEKLSPEYMYEVGLPANIEDVRHLSGPFPSSYHPQALRLSGDFRDAAGTKPVTRLTYRAQRRYLQNLGGATDFRGAEPILETLSGTPKQVKRGLEGKATAGFGASSREAQISIQTPEAIASMEYVIPNKGGKIVSIFDDGKVVKIDMRQGRSVKSKLKNMTSAERDQVLEASLKWNKFLRKAIYDGFEITHESSLGGLRKVILERSKDYVSRNRQMMGKRPDLVGYIDPKGALKIIKDKEQYNTIYRAIQGALDNWAKGKGRLPK